MDTLLLYVFLAVPGLACLAALLYALTRAPDRIQLATLLLFAASITYFAQAYEYSKQSDSSQFVGVALGFYSLFVYVCMAALALYFKRWAWLTSLGVFGLHIVLGLLSGPSALEQGLKGVVALAAYLAIGIVGIWALLHRGSRSAVSPATQSEA